MKTTRPVSVKLEPAGQQMSQVAIGFDAQVPAGAEVTRVQRPQDPRSFGALGPAFCTDSLQGVHPRVDQSLAFSLGGDAHILDDQTSRLTHRCGCWHE